MTKFIVGLIAGSVGTVWLLWKASNVGFDAFWPVQGPSRV